MALVEILNFFVFKIYKMGTEFKFKMDDNSDEILRYASEIGLNNKDFVYCGQFNYDKPKSVYYPLYGKTELKYHDHRVYVEYIEYPDIKSTSSSTIKHTEVFCYIYCSDSLEARKILDEFVIEAKEYCKDKKDDKIVVNLYKAGCGWIRQSELMKRDLDTIYIDKREKDNIVGDLDNFFSEKEDYKKFGIPYKRVYLFSGIPGSGKTSFIFALASKFKKNISIISFSSSMDDATFMNAIRFIDDTSILLLEDIDCLFISREKRSETNSSMVTFSGLLNVLDGIGRKEGLLTFMTTNHYERLDDALKRPGRIDYILKFSFSKKEQVKDIFNKFLPLQENNFENFYKSVNKFEVTMALLQKFLFENRKCSNIMLKIDEFSKLAEFYKKDELYKNQYT